MCVQELGTALYWKLRDDLLCPVDDIVNARFPGRDPTKWDFSTFERSAPAPGKKRKRATRKPLDEQNESEGEGGWDSDEHVPDNE